MLRHKGINDSNTSFGETQSTTVPVGGVACSARQQGSAKASLSGWEPKIQLEEGLRRTIAYFADKLGEPVPAGSLSG